MTRETMEDLVQEISALRRDLLHYSENIGRMQGDERVRRLRCEYAAVIQEHETLDAEKRLKHGMTRSCPMNPTCFIAFSDYLRATAGLIGEGDIPSEIVASFEDKLKQLDSSMQKEGCRTCFDLVWNLFEKQIDLLHSLGIYKKERTITEIPYDNLATMILEPIANSNRIRILDIVAMEPRSFTDLSEKTKLRGGNLLFHIRKLTNAGLIAQQNERGDYILTARGEAALTAVRACAEILPDEKR